VVVTNIAQLHELRVRAGDGYPVRFEAVVAGIISRLSRSGTEQVSGRADLTWEESVRMDLRYVDNWSIALDLQILWKTARAVVRGSGAY